MQFSRLIACRLPVPGAKKAIPLEIEGDRVTSDRFNLKQSLRSCGC
jgi:hypothetical protein